MELKGKDIYRVICADSVSADFLTSLMSLYQPLTGSLAISLYLTLYTEGRRQRSQETHHRLSVLMNQSIDEIERARIKLEEHLLLRTYVQTADDRNQYLYLLNQPMSPAVFLDSREMKSELTRILGSKQTELTVNKFMTGDVSTAGYRDITRPVVRYTEKGTYNSEDSGSRIQPRYHFTDDVSINFDYERFFSITSTLVFPVELRTEENLRLIGKLATIYGLTPERMRQLTGSCVNIGRNEFDAAKLKLMAEKSNPEIVQTDDPYKLPPVSFLQSKQNGRDVSLADRKILEYLSDKMNFSVEVVNIMIEYILSVSSNRLVPKFVEMVAGEWARDNVKTREDAIAETKKKKGSDYRRKQSVPQYMLEEEQKEETAGTDTDINEVREMLKRMGKV